MAATSAVVVYDKNKILIVDRKLSCSLSKSKGRSSLDIL
jgi:hypothetical protein